jgi:hypothetical protein
MINSLEKLDVMLEGFQGSNPFNIQKTCMFCGGTLVGILQVPSINPYIQVTLDLCRCSRCGHGTISPLPSQDLLNHLYRCGSPSVIAVGWEKEAKIELTEPEAFAWNRIQKANSPGRCLEIGVGKGLLYSKMMAAGWKCRGIDPGDWGQSLPGVVRSIDQLATNEKFDCIIAFDVFEHMSNPMQQLTQIATHAEPGTELWLAFPRISSFRFAIQRLKWRMLRPIGHVHFFSRRSIEAMLSANGFELVSLRSTDLVGRRWPWSYVVQQILFFTVQLCGFGDQWIVQAKKSGSRE